MDPRIDEYIRQNRDRYTREAIRDQLIAAGHDPAAIDKALDEAWSESPNPLTAVRRTAERMQNGWAIFLYLAGFSIPIWLFLWTLSDRSLSVAQPIAFFVFLVGYAIVGYLVVRRVTKWGPPSGFLDWERAIVGLPLVFALLLGVGFFTTCLAAYRLG